MGSKSRGKSKIRILSAVFPVFVRTTNNKFWIFRFFFPILEPMSKSDPSKEG